MRQPVYPLGRLPFQTVTFDDTQYKLSYVTNMDWKGALIHCITNVRQIEEPILL
jgi:hypothetical protein